jgi:hypothetical protein
LRKLPEEQGKRAVKILSEKNDISSDVREKLEVVAARGAEAQKKRLEDERYQLKLAREKKAKEGL